MGMWKKHKTCFQLLFLVPNQGARFHAFNWDSRPTGLRCVYYLFCRGFVLQCKSVTAAQSEPCNCFCYTWSARLHLIPSQGSGQYTIVRHGIVKIIICGRVWWIWACIWFIFFSWSLVICTWVCWDSIQVPFKVSVKQILYVLVLYWEWVGWK